MPKALLSQDTTSEAEQVQVQVQVKLWRAMSPLDKAQLTADLSRGVRELALVGIRDHSCSGRGPGSEYLAEGAGTLGVQDLLERALQERASRG